MGGCALGAVFLGDAVGGRLGRGCARSRNSSGRAGACLLGVGVPERLSVRAHSLSHVGVGHSDPRRPAFERCADGESVGRGSAERFGGGALSGPRRPGS